MFGNDQFTKVLLHMDGAAASTSFPDNNAGGSAHTWTAGGTGQVETSQVVFGTGALACGAAAGWVDTPNSSDLALGSGDFTIDCRVFIAGGNGTFRYFACQGNSAFSNPAFACYISSANTFVGQVFKGGVATSVTGGIGYTTTGWHHYAFVRTGNVLRLFIDGVQDGVDTAFTGTVDTNTNKFTVGRPGEDVSFGWNGDIDEFRLSVGIARWTANFTPPLEPYDAPVSQTNAPIIELRTWPQTRQKMAIQPGHAGIDARQINFVPHGFPVQPPPPPHRRTEKFGGIVTDDDGTERPFQLWRNFSWPIQLPQPPHRKPERFGGIVTDDDGTEGKLQFWRNAGWEVQPVQPPHWRPEQRGAGIKGKSEFAIFPSFVTYNWHVIPYQPQHVRWERGAATMRGPDGTDARLLGWQLAGWEVQSPQPPHPRPEKSAAGMRGEDGTEATYSVWIGHGWAIQLPQPPHPRPERFGSVPHGDDGSEAPFARFISFGFEVQPTQPPHRRFERAAAGMEGDDGDAATFRAFVGYGWFVTPPQPPHPRRERAGALAAGDPGNEAPFVFIPAGFTTWGYQAPTEPRGRARRIDLASEDLWPETSPVPAPAGWWGQTLDLRRLARRDDFLAEDTWPEAAFPQVTAAWAFQQADLRRPARTGQPFTEDVYEVEAFVVTVAWGFTEQALALARRKHDSVIREAALSVEHVAPAPFAPLLEPVLHQPSRQWYKRAAALPYDESWFMRSFVSVFYARSRISQAAAVTTTKAPNVGTTMTGAGAETVTRMSTAITIPTQATASTTVKGEPPGGY